MYEYKCTVIKVIDGDTVQVEVDHGMQIRSIQNIRLSTVFAPELSEPGGKEMKAALQKWCSDHSSTGILILNTKKDSKSFNRYVGTIIHRDDTSYENVLAGLVYSDVSMNASMNEAIKHMKLPNNLE